MGKITFSSGRKMSTAMYMTKASTLKSTLAFNFSSFSPIWILVVQLIPKSATRKKALS